MASMPYQCTICKQLTGSVVDLHRHHMQFHTVENLSLAIINLRGINVSNDSKDMKNEVNFHADDIAMYSNSNNINLGIMDNSNARIDWKIYCKEEKEAGYNVPNCLLDCCEVTAWEHELNKTIEIKDTEFLKCVTGLCRDLESRNPRGKKKKYKTMAETKAKNIIKSNQEQILSKKENIVVEEPRNTIAEVSTTNLSPGNNNNLDVVSDKVTSEAANFERHIEKINCKDESIETSPLVEIDCNNHILLYDSSNETYFWGSILDTESDEQEVTLVTKSDRRCEQSSPMLICTTKPLNVHSMKDMTEKIELSRENN